MHMNDHEGARSSAMNRAIECQIIDAALAHEPDPDDVDAMREQHRRLYGPFHEDGPEDESAQK